MIIAIKAVCQGQGTALERAHMATCPHCNQKINLSRITQRLRKAEGILRLYATGRAQFAKIAREYFEQLRQTEFKKTYSEDEI